MSKTFLLVADVVLCTVGAKKYETADNNGEVKSDMLSMNRPTAWRGLRTALVELFRLVFLIKRLPKSILLNSSKVMSEKMLKP